MRDAGPAVARHPDALTIHAAVQLAAAAVLLQEGVEGGEENHGRSIADSAMDEHVPTRIQKAAAIGAGGV